eukprot:1182130-Prorocentrum_minimum.AAC.2
MERRVAAGRWTPLLLLGMLLNAGQFAQGTTSQSMRIRAPHVLCNRLFLSSGHIDRTLGLKRLGWCTFDQSSKCPLCASIRKFQAAFPRGGRTRIGACTSFGVIFGREGQTLASSTQGRVVSTIAGPTEPSKSGKTARADREPSARPDHGQTFLPCISSLGGLRLNVFKLHEHLNGSTRPKSTCSRHIVNLTDRAQLTEAPLRPQRA